MLDVTYKNHTIKLKSTFRPENGQWGPFAMVWSQDITYGYPIVSEEWQDTEALANAVALDAQAWIDAKEK